MMDTNRYKRISFVAAGALLCSGAHAFTFEAGDGSIKGIFDSTVTAGVGIRAKTPPCDTVVGTRGGVSAQPTGQGAPAGCLDSFYGGNDQGNLNYQRGDAFTTYLKGTHELLLTFPEDFKFMARVNWIRDFSATHTSGFLSGIGSTDSQSTEASQDLRFKARLLDLWVSKGFSINGEQARLRLGNQVINWGESFFIPGGINQTNAMDLMRLAQPGTQLKEAMLPAPIADLATGLGKGFNLEVYVQGAWNRNYFPPVGSYWSTSVIGKGAAEYGGGAPGVALPTASTPRSGGQYGMALRYHPEETQMNVGLYAMRYHDKSPVVQTPGGGAPVYSYLEDRTLYGASINFPLGNWAIGSELSFRPRDAVTLNSLSTNFACPDGKCYVEEKKYQLNLTALLSLTPGDHGQVLKLLGGADAATFIAEAAAIHYPGLKRTYSGATVASGGWGWGALTSSDSFFTSGTVPSVGDKTSWGYNLDFSWTYDSTVIPGWQVTPEVFFFQAIKGRTPNATAQFMEGAKSANFIVTFTQNPANWVAGINYAKFWGGDSIFDQPLRGRDFYGAYVTRNF